MVHRLQVDYSTCWYKVVTHLRNKEDHPNISDQYIFIIIYLAYKQLSSSRSNG